MPPLACTGPLAVKASLTGISFNFFATLKIAELNAAQTSAPMLGRIAGCFSSLVAFKSSPPIAGDPGFLCR